MPQLRSGTYHGTLALLDGPAETPHVACPALSGGDLGGLKRDIADAGIMVGASW